MKLDRVIELLVKFGFTPDYVVESISAAQDPKAAFERIKIELFIRWDEMNRPKELQGDYDKLNGLTLKSVIRGGGESEDRLEDTLPKITADEFRRMVAKTAGEINMACDDVIEGFLDTLPEQERAFLKGSFDRKKCKGGC